MTAAERAQLKAHLWRLVRFPAFISLAAALVSPFLHAAMLRFPAIGVLVALLEIFVRTLRPTAAVTALSEILAPPVMPVTPPADAGTGAPSP